MDRTQNEQWTHVGQPGYDDYLGSELRQAFTVLAATGARVELGPCRRRRRKPGVQVLDLNHQLGPQGKFDWSVEGVRVRSNGVHLSPALSRPSRNATARRQPPPGRPSVGPPACQLCCLTAAIGW